MVNLDNVESGDTLVVEVEVISWDDPGIYLKTGVVRNSHGTVNSQVKVLEHRSKPIDEPMGLGAVVQGTWGNTYRWVRVGTDSERPWQTVGLSCGEYPWDTLQKKCADLEVLSEGFED